MLGALGAYTQKRKLMISRFKTENVILAEFVRIFIGNLTIHNDNFSHKFFVLKPFGFKVSGNLYTYLLCLNVAGNFDHN
jgi:hypothetical protein